VITKATHAHTLNLPILPVLPFSASASDEAKAYGYEIHLNNFITSLNPLVRADDETLKLTGLVLMEWAAFALGERERE